MEHPDNVTAWLRSLSIKITDDDACDISASIKLESRVTPITPPRRSSVVPMLEDPSPISTIFSEQSIFDTLVRNTNQVDDNEDDFRDDASGITSITSTTSDSDAAIKATNEPPFPSQQQLPTPPESIDSYEPPYSTVSEIEYSNVYTPTTPPPPTIHNPTLPRTVNITSCLQCTLSHLPCSRTPPSCSRCIRNGCADVCLLTRRLFAEENSCAQSQSDLYSNMGSGQPVLLKIAGEKEDVWMRKMETRDVLMADWREREDRRNWVFPSLNGGVGLGERGRKGWDGVGRVVYRELCVLGEGGGTGLG
ncbi:hypothetical protein T440DRAFT_514840 [Plenodomus tracheiphilus IPT5]|uniref:Zn(2)-C6 fungal-type domain-containing protein n=1 Tax=Plenodomus tracheiphilus IPT5 TaxID=1408161 RepID=A0A6A7BI18_9PLEO|nr:hypothetical protein T440DRAFT_514840 [Plenodomus tracheiphilus IPT5]